MTRKPFSRPILLASAASLALLSSACTNSVFEAAKARKADATKSLRSPAALMRMGDVTIKGGDAATAARFYQAAAEAAPDNRVAKLKLAYALQRMGAHKAAVTVYRAALKLKPDDAEAERRLANSLISLDQPKAAIAHYRAVIARTSDYRAFNGLGVALDMTGDHKAALTAYRAGLAQRPKNLSLKNNLALSMALAGKYKPAAAMLRQIAQHPRATARHRQNLALVYGLAGQLQRAARVARIDLETPAVARNMAYYEWLRRQPRWVVKKMLRRRAPAVPQAGRTESRRTIVTAVRPARHEAGARPRIRYARLDYGYRVVQRGLAKPLSKPNRAEPRVRRPRIERASVVRGPELRSKRRSIVAVEAPKVSRAHFTRQTAGKVSKIKFIRAGLEHLMRDSDKPGTRTD